MLGWPVIAASFAIGAAVFFGILAMQESVSPRKGKMIFLTTAMLGLFCITASAILLDQRRLPALQAEGEIQSVSLQRRAKRYHSEMIIHSPSAGDLAFHAAGMNRCFRVGEHVKVLYQESTGSILQADFITPDGRVEGSFHSTGSFSPNICIALGILLIFFGWWKYQRDPCGAELRSARSTT